MSLKADIQAVAQELGFCAVGVASVEPMTEAEAVMVERVRAGLLQGMPWFSEDRVRLACHPEALLPGAKSLVMLAASYASDADKTRAEDGRPRGRVSRYAWGRDYHDILRERLGRLIAAIAQGLGQRPRCRIFVDSSPLAEREAARRAGLGWFGKNTMLLLPRTGSYVFLCGLLLDVELEPDAPLRKSCGECDLCLRACPTGALTAPYVLDSNRCISYLTIEHRGPIPQELRPLMGDWVFGCDICQEVCPVNRHDGPLPWEQFRSLSRLGVPSGLVALLEMDEVAYRVAFRGSPMKRAKRRGLRRNAAVAAGNLKDPALVPALVRALADPDPLIRGHSAWALGQIGGAAARGALEAALAREDDPEVAQEIRGALEHLPRPASSLVAGADPIAAPARC